MTALSRARSALVRIGMPALQHDLDTPEKCRAALGVIWSACAVADTAGVGKRVREHVRPAEDALEDLCGELELARVSEAS